MDLDKLFISKMASSTPSELKIIQPDDIFLDSTKHVPPLIPIISELNTNEKQTQQTANSKHGMGDRVFLCVCSCFGSCINWCVGNRRMGC